MRFTGLASVLSMVLGVSLGGIAHAGDCGCTTSAPAAVAPCGQQYVTKKVCVPEWLRKSGPAPRRCAFRKRALQGHLLRSGSRYENGSMHVYGHGSPGAKADGDVLRGGAGDAASDGNLPGPGADYRTVANQLHGLRSGLDRPDGAVYGDGCLPAKPARACAARRIACRSRRRARAASTRGIGKIGRCRPAASALRIPARRPDVRCWVPNWVNEPWK